MHEFEFTHDWQTPNFPTWERVLPQFVDAPRILEIGCYEGRATVWFLQHYPGCGITCIDTFEGGQDHKELGLDFSETRRRFEHNVKSWLDEGQVALWVGESSALLRPFAVDAPCFDLILIDGSHLACDVLSDIVLSWPLLAPGGIMILDDYGWGQDRLPSRTPKPAIDAFRACYGEQFATLELGYQFICQKL